jgi:capsid protein
MMPYNTPGYIDGMKFDEFGNVEYYELLKHHPGSSQWNSFDLTPEQVPAEFVMHWMKLRRPGQHRAVPECTSTLNIGANARRWREAQVSTAEKIARLTLMLKSQYGPDVESEVPDPLSTLDVSDGMMTVLPDGLEPYQLDPKHPAAAHESFHHSLIGEQARPKSMPRNKAMCDSSSYNYASGRLDHQTYYSHLDVDREDCNDLVLDPLFAVWFNSAVRTYGWLGGDPDAISEGAKSHIWDWPKHRVADIVSEATANKTKLETGEESLANLYATNGRDYADDVAKEAEANGIKFEQQQQINMLRNMPQHLIPYAAQIIGLPAAQQSPQPTQEVASV